ncbi:metallophosphoesterase, partial [Marinobacter alexandrii]
MTTNDRNRPFRVLQLTDPHLMADANGELLGVNTRDSLDAVIAQAIKTHGQPDLILATGDLAQDGSEEAYRAFGDRLQAFVCGS